MRAVENGRFDPPPLNLIPGECRSRHAERVCRTLPPCGTSPGDMYVHTSAVERRHRRIYPFEAATDFATFARHPKATRFYEVSAKKFKTVSFFFFFGNVILSTRFSLMPEREREKREEITRYKFLFHKLNLKYYKYHLKEEREREMKKKKKRFSLIFCLRNAKARVKNALRGKSAAVFE